jgi:dTMP kinase
MRAPFIVLEGLDGSGTTTQAAKLVESLRGPARAVHLTREPSDGPIGTLIRQALARRLTLPDGRRLTPETLALLFAADRVDHLASEIEPLRERGTWVVCDRYVLSSIAYQGQELDDAFVVAINAKVPAPDLTLFLRVTPETALTRRQGRALGEELYEALETQRRVAAAYDQATQILGGVHRVVTIDGEKSMDAVARDCLARAAMLEAQP